MANPLAGAADWTRHHGGLAMAAGAGGLVVIFAARRAQTPAAMPAAGTGTGSVAAGAAGTDAGAIAAAITQGAGIALQGAGLGLPYVQGGLDLAGQAIGVLGGAVGTLAGSQADTAATLAGVTGLLIPPFQPAIQPIFAAPAPQPMPAPTPPSIMPSPSAPTVTGWEAEVGAGSVTGYIVSATGGNVSSRTLSFSSPTSLSVVRQGAGDTATGGRIYWRVLSGGYSGVSFVSGLSTGDWHIVAVMSDGSRVRVASDA